MKKVFIILGLIIALFAEAQTISVSSFKLLDTDLTANTTGTMEMDQNGETAALIKVVTTQTGFTFDGGSLGIVKTKQTPGEVWVYIPKGSKKISVKHPQLGVLRDYYYPIAIEAARTYEMVLVAGEVQTIVKQARTSQFVVFQLEPSNAVVEIEGEQLETYEGTATKLMKFGNYSYRINAPNYLPEAGSITVNSPTEKHIVKIALKPNFSHVKLVADENAEIWVNGIKKGFGTWNGDLGPGTYEFEAKKENHRSQSLTQDITVSKDPVIINLPKPTPIVGEATINSSPAIAEVYIDDKRIGESPLVIPNLLIGKHSISIRKSGFRDNNSTITIKENEATDYSVKLEKDSISYKRRSPDPIYYDVYFSSDRPNTELIIDEYKSITGISSSPLMTKLLGGSHVLKFRGYGQKEIVKQVNIDSSMMHYSASFRNREVKEKGGEKLKTIENNSMDSNYIEVSISSDRPNTELIVDNVISISNISSLPVKTKLLIGSHVLKFRGFGQKEIVKQVDIDSSHKNIHVTFKDREVYR